MRHENGCMPHTACAAYAAYATRCSIRDRIRGTRNSNIPSTASTSSALAQLRRFAREFMELTECRELYRSSKVDGRDGWGRTKELPAAGCQLLVAGCSCCCSSCHELDLPFSQGLRVVAASAFNFQGKILKYLRRKIIYLEFSAAAATAAFSLGSPMVFMSTLHTVRDQTRSSHLYK